MKKLVALGLICVVFLSGCQSLTAISDNYNKKNRTITIEDNREKKFDLMVADSNNKNTITLNKAKEIALDKIKGKVILAYEAYDNGIGYYEIEVESGNYKYKLKISSDGKIIQKNQETYKHIENIIGINDAKERILEYSGGGNILYSELVKENGYYDIKLIKDNKEFKGKVNSLTGEVIQLSVER